MKLDRRPSFPRRMIGASAKACVAIAALAGAANWAAKGYPDKGPTIAAIAAKASEDPVTTGSIVPRNPAETLRSASAVKAAPPAPAPEKIVARAPDFDQSALAKLAAGTTPAATPVTAKAAAPRKRQEAEARPAR